MADEELSETMRMLNVPLSAAEERAWLAHKNLLDRKNGPPLAPGPVSAEDKPAIKPYEPRGTTYLTGQYNYHWSPRG